jgi:N-acetylmuramic acid 6-phosphate etherase
MRIVDRSNIDTEKRNNATAQLHSLSAHECVDLMIEQDREIHIAMKKASESIGALIDAAKHGFCKTGRLIYLGAGTSGRLGVLDASEAPPTFYVARDKVCGIIAGGDTSLRNSSEAKEDDPKGALAELEKLHLNSNDTVVGIASGGTTPYVHGALEYAKECDNTPITAFISCSKINKPNYVDHMITLETGPEVLTGSTRLKAGTATKMTLNIISTTLMNLSGRIYKNYMIDMKATNEKLTDRAMRIISECCDVDREEALHYLKQAGSSVKKAIVMINKNLNLKEAEDLIKKHSGKLGSIL